jgi:hypothetical protein
MFDTGDTIREAFSLLGAALESRESAPYEIVVVGGAALSVIGVGVRATKDIDVLALRSRSPGSPATGLFKHKPLPSALLEAAEAVEHALGLDHDWLNAGPADLVDQGMPKGFESRLTSERYGSHLTVWFPSREDLICLKTYAAADTGVGRHTEDLRALGASCDELLAGALWARSQDPSEAFREMLIGLLRHFHCDEAAKEIAGE